ncbi:hypothetical protein [Streptomyces sp. NPDC005760]|uniref:hypothetical protein n=1 Tax=Streptomyces sp. NPDC005760 TaxID=3156718 RepID=UPI000F4F22CB
MTTTSQPDTGTLHEAGLTELGEEIIRNSRPGGGRAATQALVAEGTIFALPRVRAALLRDTPDGAVCWWEGISGLVYTLGLDQEQRDFLGLVLSLVGIGHITLAAAQDLDERRMSIILRAILQMSGNDTIAVGTRL